MCIQHHRSAPDMNVLALQRGARHRYAIPRLLEEAGMLTALYTDSCVRSPVGRLATGLSVLTPKTSQIQALTSRNPLGIPTHKIFSSDRALYSSFSGGLISPHLSPVYKRWGLRGATVVYSMSGEDRDFLEWAKGQGARIIIDVFIHPGTSRIVADEKRRLLGKSDDSMVLGVEAHFNRVFDLADILLCPSEWVADGVRAFSPEHAHKIRMVPYGSSLAVAEEINSPTVGRILFAGREPLRKGLPYLARAAGMLRRNGLEIDVRVAGVAATDIIWMEHCEELNCLGTVPMEQMTREYEMADVFVLPSLSEGQAGVVLEAMASGCPVIATRESGVDFEPGCGITITARDSAGLAKAISDLLNDRELRNELARGALRQAENFSMDAWKIRLVNVVKEAV